MPSGFVETPLEFHADTMHAVEIRGAFHDLCDRTTVATTQTLQDCVQWKLAPSAGEPAGHRLCGHTQLSGPPLADASAAGVPWHSALQMAGRAQLPAQLRGGTVGHTHPEDETKRFFLLC